MTCNFRQHVFRIGELTYFFILDHDGGHTEVVNIKIGDSHGKPKNEMFYGLRYLHMGGR